jgi:DNA polymerase I-like protein with 3'-5' exonuclease and polymerase domains
MFAAGELTPRKLHDDPYPEPWYQLVDDAKVLPTLLKPVAKQRLDLGLDSEGSARKPWSIQWSHTAGTGFLARAKDVEVVSEFLRFAIKSGVTLTYHNSLHDRAVMRAFARVCGWGEHDILFGIDQIPFDDTMVMAYLLQLEPQGLKGLATRHANMAMQSYDETIGDAQNRLALDHLQAMWDCLNFDYEEEQQREFARINSTPLLDEHGQPKRHKKTGEIRYRATKVLPKLPKSGVFKAVERCMRAKTPFKNWNDQYEDIKVAGYALLGDMPEASLSHVEFPRALHYGCRDADATVRVKPEMAKRVDALGLRGVYDLEISTYPLIDRMMVVGMKPDLKVFKALSSRLAIEIADLQVAIETAVGKEGFNANSGDQVSEYLFGTLGFEPIKMTETGDRASTNDKILETLEKEHGHQYPVISDIRSYREQYKLKHTFVDRIPDFVHRYPFDGRVHATFRTTRVITGRLAASDPNILAQPEHGKFAKDFKAGWVAESGHLLGNWDLSQVELRVLAHLSRDPVLCEAYTFVCPHTADHASGKTHCKRDACILRGDLHAKLAHQVFGVKPSLQDDSKHRLPAKTHNFGLAMGMTCYGLMIELRKNGVEVDEEGAQEWIDASNRLYKRVPIYKAEKIAEARRNGFVRCLSGRIRYIGGIRSKDERLKAEAERFAFSTPIQEGAQRSMKEAEAYIYREILMKYYRQGYYKGGPKGVYVEPLCQVHDALKFEFYEPLARELNTHISHAMTKVPTQLIVPLGVEGKFGHNMRDMSRF